MLPLDGEAQPWIVTHASEVTPRFSPTVISSLTLRTKRVTTKCTCSLTPGRGKKYRYRRVAAPSPSGPPTVASSSIEVETLDLTPSFRPSRAKEMFRGSYLTFIEAGLVSITYDVSPDGQHFAMIERGNAADLVGELYVITD